MAEIDSLNLLIKSGNQTHEDHIVECQRSWTILQLKEHLAKTYPTTPDPDHQRLIYCGKLLTNTATLADIFRNKPDIDTHTLHLVCTDTSTAAPKYQAKISQSSRSNNPATTNGTYLASGGYPPTQQGHLAAWQQYYQQQSAMFNTYTNQVNGAYAYMRPTTQQYMALRRMYTNQYIMQYMQYCGYPSFPLSVPQQPCIPLAQVQLPDRVAPAPNITPPVAPAPPGPAPQAVNQNMVMNAQGGMEEDDEIPRDWLDWVYTASRICILLAIMSFYSTLGRFTIVLLIFGLFYFYQNGYFGHTYRMLFNIRREQGTPMQQPPVNNTPEPATVPEPENATPTEQEGNVTDLEETPTQADQTLEPPVNQPGVIYIIWCFISSFFTSLFPQRPPEVNAN